MIGRPRSLNGLLPRATTIASQIPNVVRSLVADAALGAAFIPVFNELLEKGDEKRAWRVASTVTTLAFLGLASITALTMLFAEPLLGIFYEGPVPHIAVQLTWILMPTVVLLGFAGIVQAILNSFGEFFVPAIAPVLWNLVIAGGLLLALTVDDADDQLLVYAWATLLPLAWLVIVTMSAGLVKLFSSEPKLGFLARAHMLHAARAAGTLPPGVKSATDLAQMIANDYLDAAVTAFFLVSVVVILADSAREWYAVLSGAKAARSTEVPFQPRVFAAGD